VAGASPQTPRFADVDQELQELSSVFKVTPEQRRHMLEVFHGMRALETALKEMVRSYGFSAKDSIGGVLHQLAKLPSNHSGHLDQKSLNRFTNTVRKERNRFMHNANEFPRSARETNLILGEVAACLTMVVK
jgi:hypothetical protein